MKEFDDPVIETIEVEKPSYETVFSTSGDCKKGDMPFHKTDKQMVLEVRSGMKQCKKDDIPTYGTWYTPALMKMITGEIVWDTQEFSVMLLSSKYKFNNMEDDITKIAQCEVNYIQDEDKPEGFNYIRHEVSDKKTKIQSDHKTIRGSGKVKEYKDMIFSPAAPFKYIVVFRDTGDPKTSVPLVYHDVLIRCGTTWTDKIAFCTDGIWQVSTSGSA
jgi:hypothetical protein